VYRSKLKKQIIEPYNIRIGWTLVKFCIEDINDHASYKNNLQIQLTNCTDIFIQDLVGSHQPMRKDVLNIPPMLFQRICHIIKKKHPDNVPPWICLAIHRSDNFTQEQFQKLRERKAYMARGRIRYFIGVLTSFEFDKILDKVKHSSKSWQELEKFLDLSD
jgi:hypothetical protein